MDPCAPDDPATDASGVVDDLIFDVGAFRGEDTDFYLSKGFRVVAIEANPQLAGELRTRFAPELATGRLRVVNRAIDRVPGETTLWVKPSDWSWGTTDAGFRDRARAHEQAELEQLTVECVPLASVVAEHGTPHYVKIDIEGKDRAALESLRGSPVRPRFVSVESCATALQPKVRDALDEVRLLQQLGYRRFAFVNQLTVSKLDGVTLPYEGEPIVFHPQRTSSGPFGNDLRVRWHGPLVTKLLAVELAIGQNLFGTDGRHSRRFAARLVRKGLRALGLRLGRRGPRYGFMDWYDLHARR